PHISWTWKLNEFFDRRFYNSLPYLIVGAYTHSIIVYSSFDRPTLSAGFRRERGTGWDRSGTWHCRKRRRVLYLRGESIWNELQSVNIELCTRFVDVVRHALSS